MNRQPISSISSVSPFLQSYKNIIVRHFSARMQFQQASRIQFQQTYQLGFINIYNAWPVWPDFQHRQVELRFYNCIVMIITTPAKLNEACIYFAFILHNFCIIFCTISINHALILYKSCLFLHIFCINLNKLVINAVSMLHKTVHKTA